jgi:hypothetical protein
MVTIELNAIGSCTIGGRATFNTGILNATSCFHEIES